MAQVGSFRRWGGCLVALLLGLGAGAWLFADTQPRSLLNIGGCGETCLRPSDVLGLAASIGIQKFPGAVPYEVRQSDACVAIRSPFSPHRFHYVFSPRRDIRNIGDLSVGDEPYVMGCLAMMRSIIAERGLKSCRRCSNGPLEQDIAYLYFPLVSG